jgi:hypothetical protein
VEQKMVQLVKKMEQKMEQLVRKWSKKWSRVEHLVRKVEQNYKH